MPALAGALRLRAALSQWFKALPRSCPLVPDLGQFIINVSKKTPAYRDLNEQNCPSRNNT